MAELVGFIKPALLGRRSFIGAAALAGAAALGAGGGAAGVAVAGEAARADDLDDGVFTYAMPQVTTAAERRANHKRVLVVVDYQVDFVDGGVFGRIEPAVAIEDALCEVIKDFQASGDIIIYTMDTHPADAYPLTREATVNPPHCVPGTPGWEFYGRVRDLLNPENAILVKKGTYGSPDLPFVIKGLRDQGIAVDSIEMAGVSTTCRVLHNAIILYNFFPDLSIIFDPAPLPATPTRGRPSSWRSFRAGGSSSGTRGAPPAAPQRPRFAPAGRRLCGLLAGAFAHREESRTMSVTGFGIGRLMSRRACLAAAAAGAAALCASGPGARGRGRGPGADRGPPLTLTAPSASTST